MIIERKIRGDSTSIMSQFIGVFISQGGASNHVYNIVMWFLPCLFVTELLFYIIRNKVKDNVNAILHCLFIFSILGFVINKYLKIRMPWSIDTMFMAIVFYGIGYLMFNKIMNFEKTKKKLSIKISFICVLLLINFYTSYLNGQVDMNNGVYSNYFLYFISAFSGIGSIYLISTLFKFKGISFLGINSLIIMCVHEPIKRIVIKIMEILTKINSDIIRNNIVGIFTCSIVTLICILPIIYIVNKYLPFVVGKKHIENNNNYVGE